MQSLRELDILIIIWNIFLMRTEVFKDQSSFMSISILQFYAYAILPTIC